MTETFDFVEACVRMKAGKIVVDGHNFVYRMNGEYSKIENATLLSDGCTGVWGPCDHSLDWFTCQTFREYIPTVSGKEAICAFIDDPSLKVRCVDWDEGRHLSLSDRGAIVTEWINMNKCQFSRSAITNKDLQNGKWTIEKGEDK